MDSGKRWEAGSWVGVGLAVLAGSILALEATAMPVVVDVPLGALVVAGAGLVLQALALTRALRRRAAVRKPWIVAVALVVTSLVAALAVHQRFLSFRSADVRFAGSGIELAGTLHTPRSAGPHPAVVFVHGSGPETRDEYEYFARLFARAGFAALAYDKRGTGRSGGDLYEAAYRDYADDALAAVRFLGRRERIDERCIGLVGFSEGEWVAPLAASQSTDIAFLIVVAPSGLSPAEQVSEEIALRLTARGYSREEVERAVTLNERLLQYQRTGKEPGRLEEALRTASSEPWFRDAEDLPEVLYPPNEYRWWRSVMDFDPDPVWRRVRVPVLLLKGDKDAISRAERARFEIEAALRSGGNRSVEFVSFPDGDHMLLRWPLGERVPPPLFAAGYPEVMPRWAGERSCARTPGGEAD